MERFILTDRCRGSLVGGAVGDALGYGVEFNSLREILETYGDDGITRYAQDEEGTARFSDDTQMTLFTAEGLLQGVSSVPEPTPVLVIPAIEKAYLNWYRTQTEDPHTLPDSMLGDLLGLWVRRAPGLTCLSALKTIAEGKLVSNDSKGCGGVMRVAPIGIYGAMHPESLSEREVAELAGLAAEVTHHHIVSTVSSAVFALVVRGCILSPRMDYETLKSIVLGACALVRDVYSEHHRVAERLETELLTALELASGNRPATECIRQLGEGWVADEALAIALFSVARNLDSFERCVVCAVNHDGDSDSTGSIAGNIMGAVCGYSAIPPYYTDSLELEPQILGVADALA